MVSQSIITILVVVLAIIVLAVTILVIRYMLTDERIANPVCKAVLKYLDPALWTLAGEYIFKPLFGGYLKPSNILCDLVVPF